MSRLGSWTQRTDSLMFHFGDVKYHVGRLLHLWLSMKSEMRRGLPKSSPASPASPGDEAQHWLGFASAFAMIWQHLLAGFASGWDMLGFGTC